MVDYRGQLYSIYALSFFGCGSLSLAPTLSYGDPVRTSHVTAELLLENQSLRPGAGNKYRGLAARDGSAMAYLLAFSRRLGPSHRSCLASARRLERGPRGVGAA